VKQTKKGRLEAMQERCPAAPAEPAETADGKSICTDDQDTGNSQYYILTREEAEALVNGNMKTVERWVNKLDRDRATWLLRRLIEKDGKDISAETHE
jgi:hypothetical protein